MPINDWIVGETAVLTMLVGDASGVAIDPDTIRLLIKPPGAAVQTIDTPRRIATGSYRHDLTIDRNGTWYYRWEITAPLAGAAEGAIAVQPSRFVQS